MREKRMFNRVFAVVLALICLTLAACSPMKSKVGGVLNLDTDLKLSLVVASDINPDEKSRPSPLYLRFYELKSNKLFNKADFIDLYEKDEEILGDDLVDRQVLKAVQPGNGVEEKFVLGKETQYIALYAEYFQYKDSKYKLIVPVTANNILRNSIKVKLTGNKMILIED